MRQISAIPAHDQTTMSHKQSLCWVFVQNKEPGLCNTECYSNTCLKPSWHTLPMPTIYGLRPSRHALPLLPIYSLKPSWHTLLLPPIYRHHQTNQWGSTWYLKGNCGLVCLLVWLSPVIIGVSMMENPSQASPHGRHHGATEIPNERDVRVVGKFSHRPISHFQHLVSKAAARSGVGQGLLDESILTKDVDRPTCYSTQV